MNTQQSVSKKIYLKDYQAPGFEISSTHLNFEIFNDHVIVTQTSSYKLLTSKPIVLNGSSLLLLNISINGQIISNHDQLIDHENETLTFDPNLYITKGTEKNSEFEVKITTKIDPYNNKSLEGLYKSSKYLVTQCEAQGFRKITYFPDRPDIMTSFLVTIEADKIAYPTLLSNGDLIKKEDVPNNRQRVTWKDPWKKPCYLFALFAGDVGSIKEDFKTKSGKKVSLEIYCDHGKENRCLHAMASLKKSMRWDEEVFNREYDLAQYLIVAIDDFNAGAMENKGLNIFNSRLIFADTKTATDADFFNIESVVAHEYFHNWTGNRITLRDWFQLSLKEGLTVFRDQEFSADMTEKGVQRIRDVDTLKEKQFPEDAGPNSHPVRPESCYAVDNFFTATIYEKGAEVIRMMRNLLGRKQFTLAMENYFSKYDGKAITTDDFRKVILDESGIDSGVFKKWYEIPGTPEIQVQEHFDENTKTLSLSVIQKKEVFHFPIFIAFFDKAGNKIKIENDNIKTNSDGEKFLNISEKEFNLKITNLNERPIISFLRNFSAPVKISWSRDLSDLFVLANFDDDTFNRREAFSNIYLALYKELFGLAKENPQDDIASLVKKVDRMNLNIEKFSDLILATVQNKNLSAVIKSKLLLLPSNQIVIQHLGSLEPQLMLKIENFIKQSSVKKCFSIAHDILLNLKNEIVKTGPSYSFEVAAQRELLNNLFDLLTYSGAEQKDKLLDLLNQLDIPNNFNQELYSLKFKLALLNNDKRKLEIDHFYTKWANEHLVIQKWMQTIADSNFENTFSLVKDVYKSDKFNSQIPNQVYALLRTFGQNTFVFFAKEEHWDFYLEAIKNIDTFNPQVAARLAASFQTSTLLPKEIRTSLNNKISKVVQANKLSKNTFELLAKYTN
jgi:aminopeptidase N